MGRRLFAVGRWNWSQKAEKWVYVKINKKGMKEYHYQVEPPQEFIELTFKMKQLNNKLLQTLDPEENAKVFENLMKVSKKMQEMGRTS
ncbi:MAG: hypothetical protein ACFFCV_08955 [Promethearchaeota archaeon]